MKTDFLTLLVLISITNYAQNLNQLYHTNLFTYIRVPESKNNVESSKVLINNFYAVGYSENLKLPLWAVHRLGNKKDDVIIA